jgi:hypothetical protein
MVVTEAEETVIELHDQRIHIHGCFASILVYLSTIEMYIDRLACTIALDASLKRSQMQSI